MIMMRKRTSIHLGKRLPKNFVQPQPAGFYKVGWLVARSNEGPCQGLPSTGPAASSSPSPPAVLSPSASLLACRPMQALPGDSCSFLGLMALCGPSGVHRPVLTPGKGKYFSTIWRVPSTESCSPFVGDILLCCTCKCTCNLMWN